MVLAYNSRELAFLDRHLNKFTPYSLFQRMNEKNSGRTFNKSIDRSRKVYELQQLDWGRHGETPAPLSFNPLITQKPSPNRFYHRKLRSPFFKSPAQNFVHPGELSAVCIRQLYNRVNSTSRAGRNII